MGVLANIPYISTFIIIVLVKISGPFNFEIIPGHPWISFITILFLGEILTGAVIKGTPFGKAYSVLLYSFFVFFILMVLREYIVPDSIQFCILLNLVYGVVSFGLIVLGSSVGFMTPTHIVTKIISFLLGFAGGCLVYVALWLSVWDNYSSSHNINLQAADVISLIILFLFSAGIGVSTILGDLDGMYKTKDADSHNTESKNDYPYNRQGTNNSYFENCDSLESLNKRYKDLVKVYHPDQGNGSAEVFNKILEEYEELKARYESV